MPRRCTICSHVEVATIDRKLAAGIAPISQIAREFNASEDALRRHRANHIPQTLANAQEAQALDADSLLEDLLDLKSRTMAILDTAERSGKLSHALLAIKEARSLIATLSEAEAIRRQSLSAAEANALVSLVVQSIQRHVSDRATLEAIQHDLQQAVASRAAIEAEIAKQQAAGHHGQPPTFPRSLP